jgi:apolipoprotein N-acyltransferase
MLPTAANPPARLYSFAAATLTALLLALAMPGRIGWWPLLFIALVPLLLTLRSLPPTRSACMGLFCGLLYNISLLYWIVIVLGRYGGLQPWLSVPAMALLALYMAAYLSLFCLLLNLVLRKYAPATGSAMLLLAAPTIWVGLDFLGNILFTGFPWMDLGYGLYQQPLLIQAAALGGHHLLTFVIILVNGLLVWLIERFYLPQKKNGQANFIPVIAANLFLLCLAGYSGYRLVAVKSAGTANPQVIISVIQGNIEQAEKWSPGQKEKTVRQYLRLSADALAEKPELLVWPETALPFFPSQNPLMNNVLSFIRENRINLITGSPYFVLKTDPPASQSKDDKKPIDYFNSSLLLDQSGRLAGRYDKQHLVPYGEYVPLRSYLWFLKPLVVQVGDFSAGTSFEPLRTGKIRAGILICFESIFPEIARQEVLAGSNLLVNLTNDAWYGRSSAPHQSMAMSVLRAVENRRSLVRAANTGISGFVAPTGVIRSQSELFMPAALTESVELINEQTIFSRWGHWFGPGCLALILPLLLLSMAGNRNRKKIKEQKL